MNALLRRQANNRVDISLACHQARVFRARKKTPPESRRCKLDREA
jgi:hypothetical protein